MIEINKKKNCCGCEACSQICPKQCISMHEDQEGFMYPLVSINECIDCGACERVCPVLHQNAEREPLDVYAAYNPDTDIRLDSSSGGIFTMLAHQVLLQNGVVFGASFNDKWEVVHDYANSFSGILQFRGSKYVQSRIGNAYKKVREFLKSGRMVLFSGTPCQIAGLRHFLGVEYPNLLTVDFICHGVPSPGVFRWYLFEELGKIPLRGDKNTVSYHPICRIPERDAIIGLGGVELKASHSGIR